jgi:hypothetical protein
MGFNSAFKGLMEDYIIVSYLLKYSLFALLIIKYSNTMTRGTPSSVQPINTHPGFSGRNANQISHENVRSTTIIKLRGVRGNEKSP